MEPKEMPVRAHEFFEALKQSRFNRMVAVTVSVVALVMVLGKVKDDNITRRMMAAQATQLDAWNYYQAKSIKGHLFELQVEHWQLAENTSCALLDEGMRNLIQNATRKWAAEGRKENAEKDDLQRQALAAAKEYQSLQLVDHQFHFAEALLTLAVTLFAVSALVQQKTLYGVGVAVALLGTAMTLGGFLGWQVEFSFLRFLT